MIKISVPNDDDNALFHMGVSLINMAATLTGEKYHVLSDDDLKALQRLKQATEDLMQAAPAMLQENNVDGSIEVHGKRKEVEVDTTSQQVESLADTDNTGTPWDERIHSASKALNADGTWRLRRKPKDMDEAEWLQLVADVKLELSGEEQYDQEELTRQMNDLSERYNGVNIDPADEKGDETAELTIEPVVTPEGDDFHTDAGVVTEQQVASFPPPPPVPQVLTPVQEAKMAEVMTFPQVMAFLTERHGRITSAQVDQIIADMGLEKITDLNTKPEHTGPFIARVKALLGE